MDQALCDLAAVAVEAAQAAGAEWADAVCASYRDVVVGGERSSLRECESGRDRGLGIRAFYRGGRGVATVLGPALRTARAGGRKAAEMARATHPDPAFRELPSPSPLPAVDGLFDDKVAGLPVAEAVDWFRGALEEAQAVDPDSLLSGEIELSWGEVALVSSTGVSYAAATSHVALDYYSVVRRGEDRGAYFEFDVARRLEDVRTRGLASVATAQAQRFLGARPGPTGRVPLVLGPLAAYSLVAGLLEAAGAENAQRNRSYLVGREGEKVAGEQLTIIENPGVPWGVRSSPCDGEGFPKHQRVLLEAGVLAGFLHNSYTAGKAHVSNTGHAWRSGYQPGVGIGTSNISVSPGERTEAELIGSVDQGLYINDASLAGDPVTGELSAMVDFGFLIERGELTTPVQSTMIAGNVLELVNRLAAVSSDYREEPGQIIPSLLLEGVEVVSQP